jgi:hypothetical protein
VARGKRQEASGKRQEASGKRQEARAKSEEAREHQCPVDCSAFYHGSWCRNFSAPLG